MPDRLPVMMLHGWLGRGADWESVVTALPEATTVLTPDLPGHGDAGGCADYSMDGAALAALRALDAAGASRAVVAGYSMGGRVALHMAMAHPDRIAGLVLVSASAGLPSGPDRAARRAVDAERSRMLLEDPSGFVTRWYDTPLFDPLAAPVRAALVADRLAHGKSEGWSKALTGLSVGAQPWYGDRLRDVIVPAAVLAGAVDAKFSALALEMAEAGGFDHTIIPGAGHALLVERPDAVAAAITRILHEASG